MTLFNAIRKHQKEADLVDDTLTRKRGKSDVDVKDMSKKNFLELLKKDNSKKQGMPPTSLSLSSLEQPPQEKSSSWAALKDDYLMGSQYAKMKDWDSDGEEEDEEEI